MNKVININLGGLAFTIDEDAYHQLSSYFKIIERHFTNSDGVEDIVADIESRMGELFEDMMGVRNIISIADVDSAIKVMGSPADFGADDDDDLAEEPKSSRRRSRSNKQTIKTGKRLFRDPDEKLIGGVCAGITSYFGIGDPIWIRIIFILFGLLGGGILVYVILWAIIPKAITSADRLAMKGEEINVSSIAKKVEEEIENLSNTLSEFGQELRSKKKR